jgi:predicted enzyme related to lactoylglutathione lyase
MDAQFVWFELTADNTSKARQFYEEMFGWEINEANGYAMVKAGASENIGAGIKANAGLGGVPSHWAPFVSVKDVKAATKKAGTLGAKVVQDVHVTPHGVVSTVLDPTGAALNLWQPLPQS